MTITSTTRHPTFAFHLDAPALRDGRRRSISLCRRPGRDFSFFINYMTSQVPPFLPRGRPTLAFSPAGLKSIRMASLGQRQGAANLASLGFLCFLVGRLPALQS